MQDGLDNFGIDESFRARLKSRPHQRPRSPQREGSGKPSTVRNASRCQYGCWMHHVDHGRHEGQCGTRPTVAARLGSLSDDDIGSDIERPASFSHVNDLDDQVGVRLVDGTGEHFGIAE